MPSHLDFDSTKRFRNYILGRTLTVENGPQTFTADTAPIQGTSDMSNVDPGDVETTRPTELSKAQTSNLYKPIEYFVNEDFTTIPRRANLALYPAFLIDQDHSFISIMKTEDYENESELMKFAAWNIRNNPQGPLYGRLRQNLYTATAGKVRVFDALQGNTSTAINLITGREPLIEGNTSITVNSSILLKGVDFLQTVAGVEFPWSVIPGDYLSNPRNPIINRPEKTTEAGKLIQDIAGGLGSLLGIARRPTVTRKPSDLFIEYMGRRQKSILYDNLSYSKYGPDYTTTARSQNTSKVFNFIDNVGENINKVLGLEAPNKYAYIGDDRGINVKDAMSDFNDRQIRSSYYLGMLFDPVQVNAFLRTKNIGEGGSIGGKLTWISSKSQNKLGENNVEYQSEGSQFSETLSTNYAFREDSILGLTQEILETLPTEGGASRSHVANVIDQTSRVFREDDKMMSRGSAVKYVDKFTGTESGVEYARVWTKDRSYMNYSDTMKRTGMSRKFDSSTFSNAWNLNIYPNSNGNGGFDSSSTNMSKGKGDGFYAKKYMFSIENLAWKTSNTPGFTYNDLPYCERGPNGGRVMWFPPYGLKVQEQNSAKWEENIFLGRPEPVYTYQNASRTGSIEFKVVVDHPSILNLMVKDLFKNMSDEEADNYINAFFAGAEDVDFYGLIRKYTTLTEDDVKKIQTYLNGNKDTNTITKYKTVIRPIPNTPTPKNEPKVVSIGTQLYFKNDYPNPKSMDIVTESTYEKLNSDYISDKSNYMITLNTGLDSLSAGAPNGWTTKQSVDYKSLSGKLAATRPTDEALTLIKTETIDKINQKFNELASNYGVFRADLADIKEGISGKTISNISINLGSRTSSPGSKNYNLKLAYRRSYSVIKDILNKIANTEADAETALKLVKWEGPTSTDTEKVEKITPIPFDSLGYVGYKGDLTFEFVANAGEQPVGTTQDCSDNYVLNSPELSQTAPVPFGCRETSVIIKYEQKDPDTVDTDDEPLETIVTETTGGQTGPPTPPIDEMKRIIMKTLSECYYFKKLEEDSPIQFSSLKEKLRYFHPSFHSTTPEGLNSRLTFLQQCLRPGETLPIKGISDIADLNARNTTFGPPPICVMRIGDFYHSKVAIKDINITFDEDLWDLNPEGIGVQPMIASVTLQVNFIGGHGLAKPVERLQNALSSNFYANTEVYDPRSISTEKTIGGEDVEKFTKEFLDTLVKEDAQRKNDTSQEPTSTEKSVTEGVFIGELELLDTISDTGSLSYDDLVKSLYDGVISYNNTFVSEYNSTINKYGLTLSSIILSPLYRSINNYTIQNGTGTETVQLFGEYPKASELEVLKRDFKSIILDKIKNSNISDIFRFDKDLKDTILRQTEALLNPYVYKKIGEIIDGISDNSIKTIGKRNKVIITLDKLNFIIETGHDGSIKGGKYTGVNFLGYTYDLLYDAYSDVVKYINDTAPLFSEDLDTTSYEFKRGGTMTDAQLSKFLSELLIPYITEIKNLFVKDPIFTDRIQKDINKRVDKFMSDEPGDKDFTRAVVKRKPEQPNGNPISFEIGDTTYVFSDDEKTKLKSVYTMSTNKTINELNYYRGNNNG